MWGFSRPAGRPESTVGGESSSGSRQSGGAAGETSLFGVAIRPLDNEPPFVLGKLVRYLQARTAADLFQTKPNSSDVASLRRRLGTDAASVQLSSVVRDPHVVAELLKQYLAALPEPVFTYDYYNSFMNVLTIVDLGDRLSLVRMLIYSLPPGFQSTALCLLELLHGLHVSGVVDADKLALIFAACFLRPENQQAFMTDDNLAACRLVQLMIEHGELILRPDSSKMAALPPSQPRQLVLPIDRFNAIAVSRKQGVVLPPDRLPPLYQSPPPAALLSAPPTPLVASDQPVLSPADEDLSSVQPLDELDASLVDDAAYLTIAVDDDHPAIHDDEQPPINTDINTDINTNINTDINTDITNDNDSVTNNDFDDSPPTDATVDEADVAVSAFPSSPAIAVSSLLQVPAGRQHSRSSSTSTDIAIAPDSPPLPPPPSSSPPSPYLLASTASGDSPLPVFDLATTTSNDHDHNARRQLDSAVQLLKQSAADVTAARLSPTQLSQQVRDLNRLLSATIVDTLRLNPNDIAASFDVVDQASLAAIDDATALGQLTKFLLEGLNEIAASLAFIDAHASSSPSAGQALADACDQIVTTLQTAH